MLRCCVYCCIVVAVVVGKCSVFVLWFLFVCLFCFVFLWKYVHTLLEAFKKNRKGYKSFRKRIGGISSFWWGCGLKEGVFFWDFSCCFDCSLCSRCSDYLISSRFGSGIPWLCRLIAGMLSSISVAFALMRCEWFGVFCDELSPFLN